MAWLAVNSTWLIPTLIGAGVQLANTIHVRNGNAGLGLLSNILNAIHGTTPTTVPTVAPAGVPPAVTAPSGGILASLLTLAESELSDPTFIQTVEGLIGSLPANSPVAAPLAAAVSNPNPVAAATVVRHILGARVLARRAPAAS